MWRISPLQPLVGVRIPVQHLLDAAVAEEPISHTSQKDASTSHNKNETQREGGKPSALGPNREERSPIAESL